MEHRHAEVLRAIADGKDVQYSYINAQSIWVDYHPNECATSPIEYTPHVFWRIKPEPTPEIVTYWHYTLDNVYGHNLNFLGFTNTEFGNNLKITLDGDGNVVKAEVL